MGVMGMGVSIAKRPSIFSRPVAKKPAVIEKSRDYKEFFSQFEESLRKDFEILLIGEGDPTVVGFVCFNCNLNFQGAEIRQGKCPRCSGKEMFPKDYVS